MVYSIVLYILNIEVFKFKIGTKTGIYPTLVCALKLYEILINVFNELTSD